MTIYSVLKNPVVTEKSTKNIEKGKYTFIVDKKATKISIKKAVKDLYNVEVEKINIITVPAKTRTGRNRQKLIKRNIFKKAIILTKGKKAIDVNKFSDKK